MLMDRLLSTAGMVMPGKPVADIGADHARLAIYLAETGQVPRIIIGELGNGPFQRACAAVMQSPYQQIIELRQGNGLEVLKFSEVSTVVLAGMGGDTIIEILSRNWDKAASFERFVLQPMSRINVVRRRLASRGWIIESEALVEERNRIFVVMAVRPGNIPYLLNDLEIDIGPILLKNINQVTRLYMRGILHQYRLIYKEITGSANIRQLSLADYYHDKIGRLEEILNGDQSQRHN
jgi:tRNA (adenine22-N1)-methyltransferase